MDWKIVTVGTPSLKYPKLGVEDYLGRLKKAGKAELVHLRCSGAEDAAKKMLEASEGCYRVLLDEHGKSFRSLEWARWIERKQEEGVRRIAFLIGGSEGHPEELKQKCDFSLTLSALTLMHELALLVLLEQVYRAECILSGHPYHRE